MSDVIDIGEKRKGRKKKNPEQKKLTMSEVCDLFAEAMNHGRLSALPAPFPTRFYTYEVADGVRVAVTIDQDNVATLVHDMAVINTVMTYAKDDLGALPELLLTERKAKEVFAYWRGTTSPVGKIPFTRWKSEPGITWSRLPWDLTPDHDEKLIPTWGHLLAKIDSTSARESLMAWIGSLFFEQSYRQQYVWIYGGGGNGKGAIARFLYRIFGAKGSQFLSTVDKQPNQFWTGRLVGKRLVAIPDCENYHFPSSGLFKTLSGDDPILVEPKGKDAYTTTFNCKFLFTSNQLPALSSEKADMRRPIFVRIEGGPEWGEGFEERLWAEGGAFLWHCVEKYRQYCPTHGPIPVNHDESELTDWIGTLEEPFEVLFGEWFELDPNQSVSPTDMQGVLQEVYGKKRGPQLEFLKWLERTYHIRRKTDPKHKSGKSYKGMRLKKPATMGAQNEPWYS